MRARDKADLWTTEQRWDLLKLLHDCEFTKNNQNVLTKYNSGEHTAEM